MKWSMPGRAVLRLVYVGLAPTTLAMFGVAPGLAAAPVEGPERITVYCQTGGEAALYALDPETGSRSRIVGYPVRNGVIPMANFRVSPDGTRLAFNGFKDPQSYRSLDSVWVQVIRPNAVPRMVSNLGGHPVWSP